jgi:hypothetical protein
MIKHFFKHVRILLQSIFLDKNEIYFINSYTKTKSDLRKNHRKKKFILIQTPSEYYYLGYYKALLSENFFSSYHLIGLWPYFQRPVRKRHFVLEILHEIYNRLFDFIIFYKWKKLYRAVGIETFEKINTPLIVSRKLKINKYKHFLNKKNFFNFNIKDVNIGDILYDTYLRFRVQPTLFMKDYFLHKLIVSSNLIFLKLDKLRKKYKFKFFFTSYTSYIHHGLPVRYFLKKKVKVFSGQNMSQYNKKISKNDTKHSEDFSQFKNKKDIIRKNKKFLRLSQLDLNYRFSKTEKKSTLSYMATDTYNLKRNLNLNLKILDNMDGVMFLQDFYDSPHDWGNLAFNDFYIWTIFTLNIIKKYNLKIAIKPHPNSWNNSPDSIALYERLKKKYPDIIWLDKDFPNKIIFKKIKFGISARGTVLFELAYHGIKALSCGVYPGIDFNFTIHADNKHQYKYNLLNVEKIKKPNYTKKDLLIYNYLYYHYNMDSYKNIARNMNLKSIDFSTSKGLKEFVGKYENYIQSHK